MCGFGCETGGAEVVGKRLAFLCEGLADEGEESSLLDSELVKARSESPAKDGGVDVWWWSECVGRQREERLGGAVHLDGYREQAVVARAGLGSDAIGYFALDHEDGDFERGVAGREFEQNGRSDVVGKIAGDGEVLASGCGRGSEVEVEHVLLDDGKFVGGKLAAEIGSEVVVKFDGEYLPGSCGQSSSDGASAGADFDDSARGEVAECCCDALNRIRIVEEVLSEFGFRGHVLSRC